MKYDDAYISSKDIDWFCRINNILVHVASAGGLIPDAVNDREKLRNNQRLVFLSDNIYKESDIIINEDFLRKRFGKNKEAKTMYLESFMSMAMKGFVSIDRTNINDIDDSKYHIVCMPSIITNLEGYSNIHNFLMNNIEIDKNHINQSINMVNLLN